MASGSDPDRYSASARVSRNMGSRGLIDTAVFANWIASSRSRSWGERDQAISFQASAPLGFRATAARNPDSARAYSRSAEMESPRRFASSPNRAYAAGRNVAAKAA